MRWSDFLCIFLKNPMYNENCARNSAGASHPAQHSACSVTQQGGGLGQTTIENTHTVAWPRGALIWLFVRTRDRQKTANHIRQSHRRSS